MPPNSEFPKDIPKELEWDFDLPIYDRFMAQNLLKILGVSVLILGPIFLLSYYAFILVAVVIFLTVLIRFIIEQSYRQLRFRVESRGAGFATRSKQRDVFKGISFLLILMGIANRSPPSIVIGLQQSQTSGAGIGGGYWLERCPPSVALPKGTCSPVKGAVVYWRLRRWA